MAKINYTCMKSIFGDICIIWFYKNDSPRIERILLPSEITIDKERMNEALKPTGRSAFLPESCSYNSCSQIDEIFKGIDNLFQSKPVDFELTFLALENCSPFQKKVLLAEYNIPRGYVSTYGRIAKHIGVSKGARAVGNALATNPFPLIIPCHRAVRSDGTLGGFRGGAAMKEALLSFEGVQIDKNGKIKMEKVYY
jgi:methylated-DNA-[protein]-cysteine S-methyltransferase